MPGIFDIFGAINAFSTLANSVFTKVWPLAKEKSQGLTLSAKSNGLQVTKGLRKKSKKRQEKMNNVIHGKN